MCENENIPSLLQINAYMCYVIVFKKYFRNSPLSYVTHEILLQNFENKYTKKNVLGIEIFALYHSKAKPTCTVFVLHMPKLQGKPKTIQYVHTVTICFTILDISVQLLLFVFESLLWFQLRCVKVITYSQQAISGKASS